jgi:hypothetical protein
MRRIIWSCIGLVGCLFFYKNPELFAEVWTQTVMGLTNIISELH